MRLPVATARVLVLLASGFAVAGSLRGLPRGARLRRPRSSNGTGSAGPVGLGAIVFGVFVLVSVVLAERRSPPGDARCGRVAGLGCAVLLGGVLLGLALMLLLISGSA